MRKLFSRLGVLATVKNGCHRFDGARFFCALVLFVLVGLLGHPVAHADGSLDTVVAAARAGAPELALHLLDERQPALEEDVPGWMRWERVRLRLLAEAQAWQQLDARVSALRQRLPPAFQSVALAAQAQALLHLGDNRRAREVLARLIWQEQEVTPVELSVWRRWVIESYLADHRADDAFVAIVRYRQDFADESDGTRMLIGRVLLESGRSSEARALLSQARDPRAKPLHLLARLRDKSMAPGEVIRTARTLAQTEKSRETLELLHGVVAEAASMAGDGAALIPALEAVYGSRAFSAINSLFGFTPDLLWEAYRDYAIGVGNQHHLLLGDDAAWLGLAETDSRMYPVRSRAILALVATNTLDEQVREQAHARFQERLVAQANGLDILRSLYLDSQRFSDAASIPDSPRWLLIDAAIAEGDLVVASRLMQGLEEAPDNSDPILWQLRRAKVFMLAGDVAPGQRVVERLVEQAPELSAGQLDRVVQLLFDLQTLGSHEAAYHLLARLSEQASGQFKRELLYWMADSQLAQSKPREAARLYLASAAAETPSALDPWGQTARYQAARALAQGGLRGDAGRIYRQLLAVTTDAARRAVLERELEQLMLKGVEHG